MLIQRAMAMGKQQLPALHLLTLLHITRTVLLVRLTPAIHLPRRSRCAEFARQAHHAVAKAFSVSRNSLVRFSSMPIAPNYFTLTLANTTNKVGFS